MEFLKLFQRHADYEDFVSGDTMPRPNVSHCVSENEVHYNKFIHDYSKDYLTIEALENGTIGFSFNSYGPGSFEYSVDGGETWGTLNSQNSEISVSSGDKILFKKEPSRAQAPDPYLGNFYSTCNFNAYGNPMSLIYGSNFSGQTEISINTLMYLFSGCDKLMSAENISLPATRLGNKSYRYMFKGCTSIKVAPELPATIVSAYTYYGMFSGCTSLKEAPELPATTLGESSYGNMFVGCTSIKVAPELPATSITPSCYVHMFEGCTNLITAPSILPATTLNNHSHECYQGMFKGCIRLETAPILPADNFGDSSYVVSDNFYNEMFYGCSSLNYVKCYLTTTYKNCIANWLSGVAENGVYVRRVRSSDNSEILSTIPSSWKIIYYDESEDKYYLDRRKETECDDHGNLI